MHADATPIPVLAPSNGKTKTARLWAYVRDDSASGDTIANFSGVLQVDAYAGFNALYVDGTIQEAAC